MAKHSSLLRIIRSKSANVGMLTVSMLIKLCRRIPEMINARQVKLKSEVNMIVMTGIVDKKMPKQDFMLTYQVLT